MNEKEFEILLEDLQQRCFHMNDVEAEKEVDWFISEHPEVIGMDYYGETVTKQWLMINS